MSDLKTQIRLYFDQVVEHLELDETLNQRVAVEPVPAARAHPRIHEPQNRWIYALAAAAVVVLVFIGVALLTSPDSATNPATPSPTTPTTPSTAPIGPDSRTPFATDSVVGQWAWTPADEPGWIIPQGSADGVYYFMFHTESRQPAYVSVDWPLWSELAGPTSNYRLANYRDLAESDMLIAYTVGDPTSQEVDEPDSLDRVRLWRYQSGSWAEFASPVEPGGDDVVTQAARGSIEGLGHAPDIFVDVVGPYVVVSCCDPALAGFTDGWIRVSKHGGPFATANLPAPGIETWRERQMVSLNGGLLALLDQDQLWASDDGLIWSQIEPSGVDLAGISGGEEGRVFLNSGDGRVFLLGRKTTWTSPDGRVWEVTDLPSDVRSVWRAPFGWVAVAGAGWSDLSGEWHWTGMPAQFLVSTDGVTWNTIEAPAESCFGSFVGDTLFAGPCGKQQLGFTGTVWTATLGGD